FFIIRFVVNWICWLVNDVTNTSLPASVVYAKTVPERNGGQQGDSTTKAGHARNLTEPLTRDVSKIREVSQIPGGGTALATLFSSTGSRTSIEIVEPRVR